MDERSGQSRMQHRFDALVYTALCRFGPPLPADFVHDNHVVSSSSSTCASSAAHDVHVESSDLGADGKQFVFYDEVALHVHELVTILRKVQPTFLRGGGNDGNDDDVDVPLSLLVRNCRYLRAYKGKVHYMRCLRRCSSDEHSSNDSSSRRQGDGDARTRLMLSIGMYKMREHPSQDGLRQGPQPWLYLRTRS